MKIIIRDTGKEYPRKYKEGKEEYEIDTVYIVNSSMTFNEIILFDGKRFYDEDNSPQWAYRENQKTLKKMWSSSRL